MNQRPAFQVLGALLATMMLPAAESLAPQADRADRPIYKTAYRVINVHHHWGNPDADAVQAQVDAMDQASVVAAVNLDAGRSDGTLPAWSELEKKHPGRFVNFAKFTQKDFERVQDPGFFEGLVRELERDAKLGA